MDRRRLRNLLPILLIVTAVALLLLHQIGILGVAEGWLVTATTPFQDGASSVASWFGDLAQTARDLRDLRQRSEDLETENARLLLENVRLREVEAEAVLLRDLLRFSQANPTFEVQGAHVIGRDPSNLQRYITLDVGREAGVARNMPVVTDRGLVGRISNVGTGWSRVLLIIDASSSVSALTQSTRASGSVQGQADGTILMHTIPQGDTISVGDTVFTSGLGGNFPRQLLIGQITAVERQDFELYQVAEVEPTVDFDHLEAVLVVTDFEPIQAEKEDSSAGE